MHQPADMVFMTMRYKHGINCFFCRLVFISQIRTDIWHHRIQTGPFRRKQRAAINHNSFYIFPFFGMLYQQTVTADSRFVVTA